MIFWKDFLTMHNDSMTIQIISKKFGKWWIFSSSRVVERIEKGIYSMLIKSLVTEYRKNKIMIVLYRIVWFKRKYSYWLLKTQTHIMSLMVLFLFTMMHMMIMHWWWRWMHCKSMHRKLCSEKVQQWDDKWQGIFHNEFFILIYLS